MANDMNFAKVLSRTVEKLSVAFELEQITTIVAQAAREVANADGATFVLREGDNCYYADECAISPLWRGKRFPMEACISGWAMIHRQVVCIPDIYKDDRIPHDAYRPTFVKSLCMVPIRAASPIGAIGHYWATDYSPSEEEIKNLQILANCASVAIENWELRKTVTQSTSLQSDLQQRNDDLENSLRTLVHDLRNPIASILIFHELLYEHLKPHLDQKAESYFNSLRGVSGRFQQTIHRVLALYKISGQKLVKQPTDLTLMATEIDTVLRTQEASRQVQTQIDPEMIALVDPLLVRLALENLFTNAYKFTSKKPVAKIHFGRLPTNSGKQRYFVRDNGAGFDPTHTGKLFKPLTRLHTDEEFAGTGLGLASIERIVSAHGGQVNAEGQLGEGATFYFTLPVA